MRKLLGEMAAIFPDDYLHLGGDEVDGDCWLADPEIAAWARRFRRQHGRHADWKAGLVRLFTERVVSIARDLGKTVLLWDEALELAHAPSADRGGGGAHSPLEPSGIVIDAWRDWMRGGGYERYEVALLSGHRVVWSSLAWYLDLPGNTCARAPQPRHAAAPACARPPLHSHPPHPEAGGSTCTTSTCPCRVGGKAPLGSIRSRRCSAERLPHGMSMRTTSTCSSECSRGRLPWRSDCGQGSRVSSMSHVNAWPGAAAAPPHARHAAAPCHRAVPPRRCSPSHAQDTAHVNSIGHMAALRACWVVRSRGRQYTRALQSPAQ